eukprot:COSAG01_NODE_340_length_18638_cov_56.516505_27_plen_44_part_00
MNRVPDRANGTRYSYGSYELTYFKTAQSHWATLQEHIPLVLLF